MNKAIRILTIAGLPFAIFLAAQSSGNVTLPQDKGPDKVNVSSYPAEQQKGYKVFSEKCSKCHTIARPINTTMTPPEWSRYVKRMMHKPNSGINENQGKMIYEFLVYDQENRKDKNLSAFYKSLSDEEIEKLKAQQQ
jgi:mono/diheme cytochrome c family protein